MQKEDVVWLVVVPVAERRRKTDRNKNNNMWVILICFGRVILASHDTGETEVSTM